MQSFFGLQFGQNADIDIILENQDERKMGEIKDENGRKERMYLFYDGESVSGKVCFDFIPRHFDKIFVKFNNFFNIWQVNVTLHRKTNRFEHQGIRIEFIGQIELYYDRGNHHEFLSLAKELARYDSSAKCLIIVKKISMSHKLSVLSIGLENWHKIRALILNSTKLKNLTNVTLVQMCD